MTYPRRHHATGRQPTGAADGAAAHAAAGLEKAAVGHVVTVARRAPQARRTGPSRRRDAFVLLQLFAFQLAGHRQFLRMTNAYKSRFTTCRASSESFVLNLQPPIKDRISRAPGGEKFALD